MQEKRDRANLFAQIRSSLFGGRMSRMQVAGIEAILDHDEAADMPTDRRALAYMLATAFHETARTMQPIRETGAASDAHAIEILERAFRRGRLPSVRTPYWRPDADGRSWLGRGLVQLTHKVNYAAMSQVTGIDLVAAPERAMEPSVAVAILFQGMARGSFTGKALGDFFKTTSTDWTGARRIINGRDRAGEIAGQATAFHVALTDAGNANRG